MSMSMSDAAAISREASQKNKAEFDSRHDPWFAEHCQWPVARGEKTVDQAWNEWLEHCKETGKQPVQGPRQ